MVRETVDMSIWWTRGESLLISALAFSILFIYGSCCDFWRVNRQRYFQSTNLSTICQAPTNLSTQLFSIIHTRLVLRFQWGVDLAEALAKAGQGLT